VLPLLPTLDQTPQVIFDSGQRYACEGCDARCCKFPWKILLNKEEAYRLSQIPWIMARLKETQTGFIPDSSVYRLPRAPHVSGEMACVFLGSDNACMIQQREGHDVLPFTCQSYPFSFLVQPHQMQDPQAEAYAVNSFFCKSIQENTGDDLQGKARHKYRMTHRAGRLLTFPETVKLGKVLLPAESYRPMTHALLSLWDEKLLERQTQENLEDLGRAQDAPTDPVGWALNKGFSLLLGVEKILLPLSEAERPSSPESWQEITQRAKLFQLKLNKHASSNWGRLLLAIHLMSQVVHGAHDEAMLAGKAPRMPPLEFYRSFWRLIRSQGTVPLWGLKEPIDLSLVAQVKWPEDSGETAQLFKRYYRQFIQSEWLFYTQENLLRHYLVLMSSYAYARFYAQALAASEARQEVTSADCLKGIGYADVLASISHRRGEGRLDQVKSLLLDYLLTRPELCLGLL
jgi:lysine-N-methylase